MTYHNTYWLIILAKLVKMGNKGKKSKKVGKTAGALAQYTG